MSRKLFVIVRTIVAFIPGFFVLHAGPLNAQNHNQNPAQSPAQNPQALNAQATDLCSIAAGTFISGQYNVQQVLDNQALQVAQQQTGGTGRYQQLQNYGQPNNVIIDNPHFDQDQSYGQLFHFFCVTQHNTGSLQWELKFAPSNNKIVYYSFAPAQSPSAQNQQPQFPNNNQQPQFPNNNQQPQFPDNSQQPQFPNNNQQSQFPDNNQQLQLSNTNSQQRNQANQEAIKYNASPDPRNGGIISSYTPYPVSWKQLTNNQEFLYEGPNGIKVSSAFGSTFQFSSNPDGLQMLQMQGMQNTPPMSLQKIIDEFFMPVARQTNRELVRTYPLPDLAQYHKDFQARLFKSVPVQQEFQAHALEWKDNQGLSYVTALVIGVSHAFPISNWFMQGQYIVAENAHFEAASNAFLYGLKHTEINPKWLQIVNEKDARIAGRMWTEHRSRMDAIKARGEASRSISKIYSEISDINHAGYLNNQAIKDKGHAATVRAFTDTSLITNQETGERYEVSGHDNHHWVNDNGVHISTDNALFDPRTDETLKMFNWSKFNKEQ